MRIIKKVLKYLSYSLLSILVIFSMYTLLMLQVLKKDYVNVFGYTYFVVASGSMSPIIEVNDIIVVKINDNYNNNDIITFKDDGAFITHRVVKIENEKVITKGEANNLTDDPVPKKDVIGRVVLVVSISLILKIFAGIIFIAIIIMVVNFEKIFKNFITKDTKDKKNKKVEAPLEYTQAITEVKTIPLLNTETDGIEVLELDEEKEFLNLVLRILKMKNKKLKLTKSGSLKLKYIYELTVTVLYDSKETPNLLKNIPFDELYNYDFDEIEFSKNIQDKLYEMPMYIYLKLMAYSLLYDENEYFDAIFKILKYRIRIEKENKFINNKKRLIEVLALIEKIIVNVGHEERFELKKIKEKVLINKEIREIEILN